jgi:hypothetical protein
MKFLPREDIVYRTNLKEKEVIKRLSDILEPEQIFRSYSLFNLFNTPQKPYEGKINGQAFKIKRLINNSFNSVLPRINGIIETEKDSDQTLIKVQMRLNDFLIIFLCIWFSFHGLSYIIIIAPTTKSFFDLLIPFSMSIFGYSLTIISFKIESNKSKKDLQAIFEAK